MKPKKCLILLLAPALLFSCQEKKNDSSSEDSLPSSSNSVTSSADVVSLLKEEALQTLNEMKKGNFTLTYRFADADLTDIVTPNYFYTGYLNNGSVLLNTFNDTKIAYDYEIIDGKINLKGQTFNEEQTAQGLTSLSYMNRLSSFDFSNIPFVAQGNEIVTYNENVVKALSAQLDFSDGLERAVFYKENNVLTFELQQKQSGIYQTPQGGKVKIENVGTSKIDAMDSFLSSWKKPTETLEGKGDNIFGNVSFSSSVNYFDYAAQRYFPESSINFDIYDSYLRVETINSDDVSYVTTYKKGAGDSLEIIGVDGHNEVVSQNTTKKYSDFALVGKEGFELNQFAKINAEDNYYLYLGSDAQKLAYSVTQSAVFSRFKCLKIQASVTDGKIDYLHFYTGIMQDASTGDFFYYRIDTQVLATANIISESDKKTPSKDDAKIKTYLNQVKEGKYVATASLSGLASSEIRVLTKGENFFLEETHKYDGETIGELLRGNAYYLANGKTYFFNYDYQYNVKRIGGNENSLEDNINFSISSEILSLKDNALTTTSDIINLGDSLGFISYKPTIDPASLKMTIEDEKISSLYYVYGGDGFTGNETIHFTYQETSLPATLKANFDAALPSESQTWKNYSENDYLYEAIVQAFGAEIANKVPYLEPVLEKGNAFDGDWNYEEGADSAVNIGVNIPDTYGYINTYKEYIKTLGYLTADNKIFEKKEDNIRLTVGDTLEDFLKISLITPVTK